MYEDMQSGLPKTKVVAYYGRMTFKAFDSERKQFVRRRVDEAYDRVTSAGVGNR